MRLLLVGYGKMGKLVGDLAPEYGCEIAGVIDPQSGKHGGSANDDRWRSVDVAVDFSHAGAVASNAIALARRGIDLVIGTTGWQDDEAEVRQAVQDGGGGAVVAPNFSTGVVLFEALVTEAAELFAGQRDFG
ncbi:MAG TPA: hypothetical protein VF219_10605, partial [Vicinamibacterales bacterium]